MTYSLQIVTVKYFKCCHQYEEQTLLCSTRMLVPMWATEFRANQMTCDSRGSNILHSACNNCSVTFIFLDHTFMLDGEVQKAVVQWFRHQPKEFFADWTHLLRSACSNYFNCCNIFTHVHYTWVSIYMHHISAIRYLWMWMGLMG